MSQTKGSVLVVGGGIAGVQAALDLADSGFYVHLVERSAAIGGRMSQLDKTFPTNDCSACILSPKLVECGRHLNIELLTLSDLVSLEGEPGAFRARVRQEPRYVDMDKCIACGACAAKCPKKVPDGFNLGLGPRKAAYLTYPQAVPLKYAIDPAHCIWIGRPGRCGACAKVCPTGAINFDDQPRDRVLEVGAVILAPGFAPFDPSGLDYTGYGRLPDVITSMEFERLLSPSGPTGGHMARPSDGKEPKRIAWLQCVGSRDINRAGRPYCSSVCCTYAIKQAVIAKEHARGELDPVIFFMDMRTHGKGFEGYYNRAMDEGVTFRRARVHSVLPEQGGDGLSLRYVDEQGEVHNDPFDLVVLSVGLEPDPASRGLAERLGLPLDADGFVATDPFVPVATGKAGVYVCGAASEPKDIPQSVMEASASALEAGRLLAPARWSETRVKDYPAERNITGEPARVGVFVCHCGINIAGVVDVGAVREYAEGLPGVVFAQDNLFTCSQDTIHQIAETIKRERLNRVVVASCSPRTHEALFQETLREAGLNKFLFEMANIRDQDAWVHQKEPVAATQKAKDLVRMAVAKVRGDEALAYNFVPVIRAALVVGGGVAGMTSALALADQDIGVVLVEKSDALGGQARNLVKTWKGDDVRAYVEALERRVQEHPKIDVRLGAMVTSVEGSVGRFRTGLSDGTSVEHGAVILAVGGEAHRPEGAQGYLYGRNPKVRTLIEVDRRIASGDPELRGLSQAVFIHCVGSRIPERPYCSRVCCTHAVEQALKLKELNPEMDVFMLYRDLRTYGQRERLYQEARAKGIVFVRYDLDHLPEVTEDGDDLVVEAFEPVLGRKVRFHPDQLVLATAIRPGPDVEALSQAFKCSTTADGFFLEAHMKLRPVDFATDGIYVAGLCHYPKALEESIAQAKAAAARASIVLAQEAVPAESVTALVNPAKCTACGVCARVCPYHAIALDEASGVAAVDAGLCKGCGACVAGCRSDAVSLRNTGNEQIMAAITAAMEEC